ncbi:MAG: GNAT family N-acetyltransferase [Saprospiraceae bacterium]|nr:GNAT family N-acetyltransferase [Saprospiraceae bacterium]
MKEKLNSIFLKKTTSSDEDFIHLVRFLDRELAERDGDEHAFYAQFNKIDALKNVVVAYESDTPIGCGAFKEIAPGTVEIKRMYVPLEHRSKGIASFVLLELEKWAAALGFHTARLETGKRQPEAIRLYEKNGYALIPNYGQYAEVENSVCFEKHLTQAPPV